MSQKELCYIEDIYNHETLIINMLSELIDILDEETYKELFDNHLEKHQKYLKNIEKLMECVIND